MKALPARFETQEHTSTYDPTVSFAVEPYPNCIDSYIKGMTIENHGTDDEPAWYHNPGASAYYMVGFSLKWIKGIEGLDTIEGGYESVKIGGREFIVHPADFIDRIPRPIYHEILLACQLANQISPPEKENLDFTTDSSSQTSSATETNETAPADVENSSSEPELSTDDSSESLPTDAPGSE